MFFMGISSKNEYDSTMNATVAYVNAARKLWIRCRGLEEERTVEDLDQIVALGRAGVLADKAGEIVRA